MIEVKDLNAGYGRAPVLYEIDFSARAKEITAVLGPNGSGKSTLLKTIMGLTSVYSGSVELEGEDVTGLRPDQRAKLGIAYLPQIGSVFTNLSVRENMVMAGITLEKSELSDRMEGAVSGFPFLKENLDRKVITMSGGERQMLAMAMALIRKPRVMMFDEPTANLAPKAATEVMTKITTLREELGHATIIVEQSARKTLEISDEAYLLVTGRTTFKGKAADLLKHPELGKLYLGIRT